MDKVYYKEVHFDLLYPMWSILRLVRPVVKWVQVLKKSRRGQNWNPTFGSKPIFGEWGFKVAKIKGLAHIGAQ